MDEEEDTAAEKDKDNAGDEEDVDREERAEWELERTEERVEVMDDRARRPKAVQLRIDGISRMEGNKCSTRREDS